MWYVFGKNWITANQDMGNFTLFERCLQEEPKLEGLKSCEFFNFNFISIFSAILGSLDW